MPICAKCDHKGEDHNWISPPCSRCSNRGLHCPFCFEKYQRRRKRGQCRVPQLQVRCLQTPHKPPRARQQTPRPRALPQAHPKIATTNRSADAAGSLLAPTDPHRTAIPTVRRRRTHLPRTRHHPHNRTIPPAIPRPNPRSPSYPTPSVTCLPSRSRDAAHPPEQWPSHFRDIVPTSG